MARAQRAHYFRALWSQRLTIMEHTVTKNSWELLLFVIRILSKSRSFHTLLTVLYSFPCSFAPSLGLSGLRVMESFVWDLCMCLLHCTDCIIHYIHLPISSNWSWISALDSFPTHCILSNCSLFLYILMYKSSIQNKTSLLSMETIKFQYLQKSADLNSFYPSTSLVHLPSSHVAWVQGYTNTCTWARSISMLSWRLHWSHFFPLMSMTSLQCMAKNY